MARRRRCAQRQRVRPQRQGAHLDNYQQVLSDSLIDVANNLLKDPALRKSLTLSQ